MLDAGFPPLRSLSNADLPNNLPQQVTSFVGREKELAAVQEMVAKSRLSLQVAAELLDGFPDGAFLVAATVAGVLGVKEEPGKPVTATLIERLKDKRLLLLLDNCEHVLDASAKLADAIIRSGPGVRILATSREALGIAGETTYRVPSLSLPDPKALQTVESLGHFEAVQLFIERAVGASPGFAVTNENAPAVASVCFRLDGIPLAIELAARTALADDAAFDAAWRRGARCSLTRPSPARRVPAPKACSRR